MNLNYLEIDWNLGINVTFCGIVIVFAMLLLLVLVLNIFGLVFGTKTKKANSIEDSNFAKEKPLIKPIVATKTDNNDEIIAVIAAAVASIYEGTGIKPIVHTIRKSAKPARSVWTDVGIFENTRSF